MALRQWGISGQLVLHSNDKEIPGQRVVIKQYGKNFEVEHFVGMTTYRVSREAKTLLGAIRMAEKLMPR